MRQGVAGEAVEPMSAGEFRLSISALVFPALAANC